MVKPTRSRAFSIRMQLSTAQQSDWLPQLKADVESYPLRFEELLIGGPELAPTTGMRHVHVYVAFEHARSNIQATKLLRMGDFAPYITVANKQDRDRIIRHHTKLDTKEQPTVLSLLHHPATLQDEEESTTRPVKRTKTSGLDLRAAVESGDIDTVKDLNYMLYIKTKGAIEAECAKHRRATDDQVHEHLWIHGPTGKGKTAYIKRTWPEAYWKDCCNANFEEYNGESVVVLDDFDNKRLRLMTVGKLKTLCNPAGDRCKVNYGTVHVKAKIIVTSQYSLHDCFKHKGKAKFIPHNSDPVDDNITDDPDFQAIKRRFKEVSIDRLLFEADLQLKSKAEIRALTPEQQATYDVFEPYDPEHNREVDAYSERNQSTFRTRSIGTQTETSVHGSDEDTPATHPHYHILKRVRELEAGCLTR